MSRPFVVYQAGVSWDAVAGTDRHLVEAMTAEADVLWVDPVDPLRSGAGAEGLRPFMLTRPRAGVYRLHVTGPPGATRPLLRLLAQQLTSVAVRRVLSDLGRRADAVVLANPMSSFPSIQTDKRIYFATDDWPRGATLMGLSSRYVSANQQRQLARAHAIASVSPHLSAALARISGRGVEILPNGCNPSTHPAHADTEQAAPSRTAGLVGQVNERIDLSMLEGVAGRGLPLVIVGPLVARDSDFVERFSALTRRPNVAWVGPQPYELIRTHLARLTVGLTPYRDTEFNMASFPLKTLEYLGAGLRCISTPLPALDWMGTDLVTVAATPKEFADSVEAALARDLDAEERSTRVQYAQHHSWGARAQQLLRLLDLAGPPAGVNVTGVSHSNQGEIR